MPEQPTKSKQDLLDEEGRRHTERMEAIEQDRKANIDYVYSIYQGEMAEEEKAHAENMDAIETPAEPAQEPPSVEMLDAAPAQASPARDEYLGTVELINRESEVNKEALIMAGDIAMSYHRSPGELKVIEDGLQALRELVELKREKLLHDAEMQYQEQSGEVTGNEIYQDGG